MKRMLTLILLGLLSGGLVGCHDDSDNADNNGGVDLGNGNEQIGTLYTPGELEPLMTQSVNPKGDVLTLSGTGSTLDGATIDIPPLALLDEKDIQLSFDDSGTFSFPDDVIATQVTPVFKLQIPEMHKFQRSILITLPYLESDKMPVPFAINEDGSLGVVNVVEYDSNTKTVTYRTRSMSSWVLLNFDLGGSGSLDDYVDTGYRREADGFQITNYGSELYPDGECFGMTAFSQWYYSKKKTSDGDFFPRFMEVVGTEMPPNGEERDVTAQDVIATRSFAAAIQAHNKSPETNSLSDEQRYQLLIADLKATRKPVGIGLHHQNWESAHEVLAYRSDGLGRVYVYDPNVPYRKGSPALEGETTALKFDGENFTYTPYEDTYQYYGENSEAAKNTFFPQVVPNALDGDYELKESFENIYEDAQQGFSDDIRPNITVNNYESGDTVHHQWITLTGRIDSSGTLITDFTVINTALSGLKSFTTAVEQSGEFSILVRLTEGNNKLLFVAKGQNVTGLSNFYLTYEEGTTSSGDLALCGKDLNDFDPENAKGNCLKVATDNEGNWFTSTPSLAVMNALGYSLDDSSTNSGDTYASITTETGRGGPDNGQFAGFRQDGAGVFYPPWDDGAYLAYWGEGNGINGQFDRWCQKLASIGFGGKSDWRRPTMDELRTFYLKYESVEDGLWTARGWPTREPYWSSSSAWIQQPFSSPYMVHRSESFNALALYDERPSRANYASCISNP